MKSRSPLLLMFIFILALILSVTLYLYLSGLENSQKPVAQVEIMVAKMEIPQYTKITEAMVTRISVQQVPEEAEPFYGAEKEVVGKYVAERILKGELFYKSRVLEDVAGNLTLQLKTGNRAISVTANMESGVTKMVRTGDFIDILVTLPELIQQEVVVRPDISKLLLQDLQVIAVDQSTGTSTGTLTGEGASGNSGSGSTTTGSSENIFYLTLSVPVQDLEKLALAENIGRLKFALRPKGDHKLVPTDGTIWQELLERALIKQESQNTSTPSVSTPSTPAPSKNPATTPTKSDAKAQTNTKPSYTYYTVKPGDTLMNIARTQLKDPSQYKLLQEINNIEDPGVISPGMKIKIPAGQ